MNSIAILSRGLVVTFKVILNQMHINKINKIFETVDSEFKAFLRGILSYFKGACKGNPVIFWGLFEGKSYPFRKPF